MWLQFGNRSTQGGAEKSTQGGGLSRLDSLFDSLKSPAKAPPPPSAGGRKPGVGSVRTSPAMAAGDEADDAPQNLAKAGRDAESPPAAVEEALQVRCHKEGSSIHLCLKAYLVAG